MLKPNIYKSQQERDEDKLWVNICDNTRSYLRKGSKCFNFFMVREIGKKLTKHLHCLLIFHDEQSLTNMTEYLDKYNEYKSKYVDGYTRILTRTEAGAYYKYMQKDYRFNVWDNALLHTQFEASQKKPWYEQTLMLNNDFDIEASEECKPDYKRMEEPVAVYKMPTII